MNTTLTGQQNELETAHAKSEKLAAEITELSSYIYAVQKGVEPIFRNRFDPFF